MMPDTCIGGRDGYPRLIFLSLVSLRANAFLIHVFFQSLNVFQSSLQLVFSEPRDCGSQLHLQHMFLVE
jgi:hypothetical protein